MRPILGSVTAILLTLSASTALAQEIDVLPIPDTVEVDDAKVALGKRLYNDPRLSADNTVSCASCHALHKGGTDQLPTSEGINKQFGPINSPTVFNSAHNFVQFWDGRAKDLEEQALGPVENPKEMGEAWPKVLEKLKDDPAYVAAFEKLYGGEITKTTVTQAIAEFERSLITPGSKFDEYLKGKKYALNTLEKRGWELFQEKGCISCHNGPYLGGNSYQVLSQEYFKDRGDAETEADLGRFNVTKDEADKYMFKVPMLRNVAVTAPYFHDGSVKTLNEAAKKMGKYQLGEDLSPGEVNAITAFLKSLTGKYNGIPLDRLKEENTQ